MLKTTNHVSVSVTTENVGSSTQQLTPDYESSLQKAIAWLITQRENDWGWRNDTPKVLIALQMASQHDDSISVLPTNLEMQLSTKQMEVEIVILLWRFVIYYIYFPFLYFKLMLAKTNPISIMIDDVLKSALLRGVFVVIYWVDFD